LMAIETILAFGNTFAASFNIIYMYKKLHMELWAGPLFFALGFSISILVSLWMSRQKRMNLELQMVFALACLCLEYSLFIFVTNGWVLSLFVGIAFGLFYPFFWSSFNLLMALLTEKTDRGVKYGVSFFIWPVATFFAPFLGGLVIGYASYRALFAIGIAIIVATALLIIPYRKYIPRDQSMRIDLKGIGKRNVIAVIGEGGFEGIFWIDVTIISYMFLTDEIELGALFSVFGLSAGIMAVILGRVSDKIQNRIFFLRASAVATIPCVVIVYLADSLESFAVANGILEFAAFMFPVFVFSLLTDRLEPKKNNSVVTREFLLDVGRAATLIPMIGLLYIGVTPQQIFLLCIPFLLMTLQAEEKKKPAQHLAGKQDA